MFKEEFRREKQVIEMVVQKKEKIDLSKRKEGVTLVRVCGVIADEGISQQQKSQQLLYNHHTQLDLTNIKKLWLGKINLATIPKWLRKCHSL